MGEGDCAGEGTRGLLLLLLAMGMGAEAAGCEIWGVLCEAAGEAEPNCRPFPPTGPPFENPLGPLALMVTELLRLWWLEPLTAALP
jgi:hypothetical protein